MLRVELRKTWSRPLVMIAFFLVCLAQVVYASVHYNSGTRELCNTYNDFGGRMDDAWRASIHTQYNVLWEAPPQSPDDLWEATVPQRAVLTAYDYTFFTQMLDSYTASLVEVYGSTAVDAYAELRAASENGELIFGSSPAGESMADQYMVTWGFLIFMMILCVDQFPGEKGIGMVPIQSVTKRGRQKLFQTKLLVCQLSALLVWSAANLAYALTLTFLYGWGNLQSVIQDFNFNACPYNWNIGEYLAVTLLMGLLASQLTALVIFLLSRLGGSTQRSFALMGGVLILPYLVALMTNHAWLALWLPCLMHSSWLWSNFRLLKLGSAYCPLWTIPAIEMILAVGVVITALRHYAKKAETVSDT